MNKDKGIPGVDLYEPGEPQFEPLEGDELKDLREAWQGDSFFEKLGNVVTKTVAGRNTVGRVLGIGLDIGLFFAPHGSKINAIRQKGKALLGQHPNKFTYQPTNNTMDKPRYLSKTVWSAIIIALTALLQAFDVSLVNDPQAMQTIYQVVYPLAGAFGLYGLRHAVGKQITKKDDK